MLPFEIPIGKLNSFRVHIAFRVMVSLDLWEGLNLLGMELLLSREYVEVIQNESGVHITFFINVMRESRVLSNKVFPFTTV